MNTEARQMTGITCSRQGNVDILSFEGRPDASFMDQIGQSISTLRQQGSCRILIVGKNIHHIPPQDLEKLALPIRIFRGVGGVIAVAEFEKNILRRLQAASWRRHLNVFNSVEDAIKFLKMPSEIVENEKQNE
jgi:hypothetical protein